MSEFYVGYLPRAPEGIRRAVMRIVVGLACISILIALLLVFNQHPFANSTFEYLQYREYAGVIVDSPYPTLLNGQGQYLLVAPGKHRASDLVAGLNLRGAQLRGSLIHRGNDRMLEIVPGSIQPADSVVAMAYGPVIRPAFRSTVTPTRMPVRTVVPARTIHHGSHHRFR